MVALPLLIRRALARALGRALALRLGLPLAQAQAAASVSRRVVSVVRRRRPETGRYS